MDEAAADEVIARLRQHQLVDDRAFAEYWVEQRQTFRPRGARLVRAELGRLGMDRQSADASTAAMAASAEADAYRAAQRRAAQLRDADERTFQTRLGQWLGRRGFDWETISSVVARLWAERTERAERSDG